MDTLHECSDDAECQGLILSSIFEDTGLFIATIDEKNLNDDETKLKSIVKLHQASLADEFDVKKIRAIFQK